jgi:hypothetical protein
MKRFNLFKNYFGSKKTPSKSLRVYSYILVSTFTVLIYYISNKTGYYFRRYEGIVKEHDPVDWMSAFEGLLSDLSIVILALVIIIGVAEFTIQQKQENAP